MGVAERWVNMRCNLIKLTDKDNPSDNADMSNEKGGIRNIFFTPRLKLMEFYKVTASKFEN